MGLFNFFKTNKNETQKSETGVFCINGKTLKPLNELPKTGSVNDIAESLGYTTFHSVLTHESKTIWNMAFKPGTKIPLFVITRNNPESLSYLDITKTIEEIDWEFERSLLDDDDNL